MGFSAIQGQAQALEILKQAVSHDHLAHGYLFSGPSGVGKKMTALALAQYINCQQPDTMHTESCGQCPSCIKIQNLEHPDLLMVEPSGTSIKIEQIRLLNGKAALRAYEGAYKVIIMDDAHLMTMEAANSLLKTLEEPVSDTIFILITAQPQQLPVTILSRCQQIAFKPLARPILEAILTERHPELSSRVGLAAALAQGSASRAEELLADDDLSAARSELYQLLGRLTQQAPGELLLWCEKWDKDRKMVRFLLELTQLWFRDLMIWQTTGDSQQLVNQDQLAAFQAHYDPACLTAGCHYAQSGLKQLERNVSPRLILEVCLLKSRQALVGGLLQ